MKKTLVITILVIILYYIFIYETTDNFENDYSKIDCIIARYNEDLNWTTKEPFNKFKYIVYNKGDNQDFNKTNVKQIINLENVGRCDHTYLYHVINNYDNLGDIVVFLPGSVDMDIKIGRATELMNYILKNNKATTLGQHKENVKKELYDFVLDDWQASYGQNAQKNPEVTLKKSSIRPFGKWFEYHFGDIVTDVVFFTGIFSIDKRDIIQNPKLKYEELIKEVSDHSNPEVGHYLERAWAAIFYPLTYTVKY